MKEMGVNVKRGGGQGFRKTVIGGDEEGFTGPGEGGRRKGEEG